jgi:hypothetical protein
MMKFDAEILLEEVLIRTRLEWWTKASLRKYQSASRDGAILIVAMQVIQDLDAALQ